MSFANEKANHAIECHVSQCNNHCGCEDYCTLDKVCIGTHEADPTVDPPCYIIFCIFYRFI